MEVGKLKRVVYKKPFQSVKIILDAGEPINVYHPEMILVSEYMVMVARDPKPAIFFEPERVVSVEYIPKSRRTKSLS